MATNVITIENLDIRLKEVEDVVKDLTSAVGRMSDTVRLVYGFLKGTELDESGGLSKRVNLIDDRVKKLEDYHKTDGWMNRVFWLGVGVVISQIISQILK